MKLKLNGAEKILLVSVCFTLVLIGVRLFNKTSTAYLFYPWNIFLAVIPIWFSRRLRKYESVNFRSVALIAGWLLFFPNAPYILTDIFHFYPRPGVPVWYDLLLVLAGSWTGLMAGIISLMQVDGFIGRHTGKKWRIALTGIFLFAASNGIYLGRFLRYNSWDVVTKPFNLVQLAVEYVFAPFDHTHAWGFCFICTGLLLLMYYSIKNLPTLLAEKS